MTRAEAEKRARAIVWGPGGSSWRAEESPPDVDLEQLAQNIADEIQDVARCELMKAKKPPRRGGARGGRAN